MSKTVVEDDGKIFPLDLFMPEFLRCGSFYFAVAVCHSQLHVGETLNTIYSILIRNERGGGGKKKDV